MPSLRRHAPAVALWTLVAAIAAAGLAVLLSVPAAPALPGVRLPWWCLAIAFAGSERCLVHIHIRRTSHAMSLGEIPLVVGLLFATPVTVALAWTVAVAAVLVPGRPPVLRLLYNLAATLLLTSVAAAILHRAGGDDLHVWAGAALGVIGGSAMTALLLSVAMRLSGEPIDLRRLRAMVLMGLAVSATNVSLALATAAVLAADAWAALLLLAPAGALYGAYHAYVAQRREHLNLEFLYEASRTLARAGERAAGLAGVLTMALPAFHAEIAEVCLFGAEDEQEARRVTVGVERTVEVLVPVVPGVAAQLRELTGDDPGARHVVVEELGGPLAEHLHALGVREALLAGLPGDRRLIGTIMVAERLAAGSFDGGDMRLFETLATHTGSALGQEHLERRVTELRATKDELYHQAFHDPLTGLANRMLFDDRVAHALARRTGNAVVMYIDLDDFKPVNDTYGHDAGDALLRAVADRLNASLRPADTAARLGGDEFAVLLVDVAARDVPTIADRILRNFAAPVDVGGATARISASIGIALAGSGSMGADDLMRRADAAMYVAKRGGKRGYTVADHEPLVA